jgi:hypothetical protein
MMKRVLVVLTFVSLLGLAPSRAQEPAGEAPLFSAYPSYRAKFDSGTGKFSLITNMLVYNISGKTVTDVTFKQTYPDGVSVKETYQREFGSEASLEQSSARKVEGNAFYASIPTYKHRQYVVIFNELDVARRLTKIVFPGIEISYTDADGKRQNVKLQDNTQDLFIYSNVVGDLERFLAKYNKIDFDFSKATPQRKEWEFAPIAASAKGRFPTGIAGTNPGEDQYSGWFRIRTGPAGDTIQLLVAYNKTDKKERLSDQDAVMKTLREYLHWCGEFEFIQDGLKVDKGKWKKYDDAFNVTGRWQDSIKNRLGEGPMEAHVFYGAHEDVQYVILGLVHGRAFGEASGTPNPEKEAALSKEMAALIDTFKSEIVPLSYERRR